jgi:hypothetical protein
VAFARDSIQTAKLVASIDQVSKGRFLFGVGGGWNQDEMENHGTVYASRFKRMRESIEAMREIWTKSEAEYRGEFVHFDPMIARPKPVQKPHPPIHVGGAFESANIGPALARCRPGDGSPPISSPTKPRVTHSEKSSTRCGNAARAPVLADAQLRSRSNSPTSGRSREAARVRFRYGREANSNSSATPCSNHFFLRREAFGSWVSRCLRSRWKSLNASPNSAYPVKHYHRRAIA